VNVSTKEQVDEQNKGNQGKKRMRGQRDSSRPFPFPLKRIKSSKDWVGTGAGVLLDSRTKRRVKGVMLKKVAFTKSRGWGEERKGREADRAKGYESSGRL